MSQGFLNLSPVINDGFVFFNLQMQRESMAMKTNPKYVVIVVISDASNIFSDRHGLHIPHHCVSRAPETSSWKQMQNTSPQMRS